MSEFNTEDITDRTGTGKPDLTNGFNINGSDSGISPHKHTESATEPSSPSNGDAWLDTTNNVYKVYINNEWKDWLGTTPASGVYGDRGFNVGDSGVTNAIDYWDMTTSGNAADFGDLTFTTNQTVACSDGTYIYVPNHSTVNIDYFASATLGNASDFGDQRYTNTKQGALECDGTIAVHFHGKQNNSATDVIDKFSVGTAGVTAVAFGGTQTSSDRMYPASFANSDRMMITGGCANSFSPTYNIIEYITFSSESNATDAGDLTVARRTAGGAGTGEGNVGLTGSGWTGSAASNVIDRKDITTTSNATDHGDMNVSVYYLGGCANATKAHFFGGFNSGLSPTTRNEIQETNLATAGNATDFGDLTESKHYNCGASGAAS